MRLEKDKDQIRDTSTIFSINVVTLLPKITFLGKDKNTDKKCGVYDDAVDRFSR